MRLRSITCIIASVVCCTYHVASGNSGFISVFTVTSCFFVVPGILLSWKFVHEPNLHSNTFVVQQDFKDCNLLIATMCTARLQIAPNCWFMVDLAAMQGMLS